VRGDVTTSRCDVALNELLDDVPRKYLHLQIRASSARCRNFGLPVTHDGLKFHFFHEAGDFIGIEETMLSLF